ncbi:MAG TPA: tyrosine-type recombinase/integrase [Ktedonobacterales bacterium]|nr:tyrosine-type recombinase/integrase [Ktedonobacterales bacterium]
MDDRQHPEDDTSHHMLLPAEQTGTWSGNAREQPGQQDGATGAAVGAGHWRYELRRWLATLNPGRTGREYEKAIGYFFQTPGVPSHVDALSFDLLLAYRGALALRAADQRRPQPRAGWGRLPHRQHVTASRTELLPAAADGGELAGETSATGGHDERDQVSDEETEEAGTEEGTATSSHSGPLAPATVNIRLTALRQFLIHCAQVGSLPQLTPDAMRSALRRLRIERRRPYQVLAEPEWESFLAAALAPTLMRAATPDGKAGDGEDSAAVLGASEGRDRETRSPWGTPRALREQHGVGSRPPAHSREPTRDPVGAPAQARSGLTGARTAQRDHALIALALASGLRAIELSLLDLGDLTRDWHAGAEEWWLVLPDAKTKGQHGGRTLPLAPALVETLLAYVQHTGRRWEHAEDRATPLFLSMRKSLAQAVGARDPTQNALPSMGRLTPGQIGRIVDRVEAQWQAQHGESAGDTGPGDVRRISPHALRHSTAIALLEGNDRQGRPPASVEHVRGWLGHFDIRTTQGYLAHLEARRHRRPFAIDAPTRAPAAAAGNTGAAAESPREDGALRPLDGLPNG